ncbi:hypothetical protein BpHYR1_042524 [Brachionus plicatilis]|uniref:Uncharacterized protein n=1 Tax=Brachionus plicatilis TaxID=10195 RepID=A0A3M7PQQ3_BRAPC|nr:hypothetical protein BpHYR1_042524 [Brachionus plicatilis]
MDPINVINDQKLMPNIISHLREQSKWIFHKKSSHGRIYAEKLFERTAKKPGDQFFVNTLKFIFLNIKSAHLFGANFMATPLAKQKKITKTFQNHKITYIKKSNTCSWAAKIPFSRNNN